MKKGNAIFVGAVALIAAYSAWEFKTTGPDHLDANIEKKLFNFKTEQVDRIKITHGPQETLLIVRDGEHWKMKQPVEDDTESTAVDALLYSVQIQKGKMFRGEDDSKSTKWSDYGLEPPGSQIEVMADKKLQTLQVSSKNAFDGSYYIRSGDDLMLGDHGLAQVIARDPNTLRSRHLWREQGAKANRIDVTMDMEGHKEKFTLTKDGEILKLDPQPPYPVDTAKIDEWLNAITNLVPTEIKEEKPTDDDKTNELLVKPSYVINVKFKKHEGGEGEWAVTIGQDRDGDVFLQTGQRTTVYKTSSKALRTLRVGRDFFRDGKAPFNFNVEQAHEIDLPKYKLVKDGSEWKVADHSDLEVNGEKLATLLQSIKTMDAEEYPKAKDAGFSPSQHVRILDSQNKTLLDLRWGKEFKGQESWNKGMTFRVVETNLSKDGVMGINTAKLASLIDPGLVSKRAEKK